MLPEDIKRQILASEFLRQPIEKLRLYDRKHKLGNSVVVKLQEVGIQYIHQIMALTLEEKNDGKKKKAKLSLGDAEVFGQQNTPPLIKIFKAQGLKIGEWDEHKDELLEFDVSKHLTPQWAGKIPADIPPEIVAAFANSAEWKELSREFDAQLEAALREFAADFTNE